MKKVDRSEILDLGAYEQIRERFRARIIEAKKYRRVSVGPAMTFIFENHDTVLFQVQEMLRTERITSESAIAHELSTYNELVPAAGELSATLMIEYTDPAERKVMLDKLASLRTQVKLELGERSVSAVFHDQPGEEADRLPAVNYLTFEVGDAGALLADAHVAVSLRIEHPDYRHEQALSSALRKALALDLAEPS
jgi:hypothetical protein